MKDEMHKLQNRYGLVQMSIDIIQQHQRKSGAYPASLGFAPYEFAWLRDGSFCAYAMLIYGEFESCKNFLKWVHDTLVRYKRKIQRLERKIRSDQPLKPEDFLPARYTLDGHEVGDNWPNFQIDSYGIWLWCLSEYIRKTGEISLLEQFNTSIHITLDYLKLVWTMPCYDPWEEYGTDCHPSSLACVYGGVKSVNRFLKKNDLSVFLEQIKDLILSSITTDGRFSKYLGSNSIDANLLWLSVPFEVVPPNHPTMRKTVLEIENRLLVNGGVKRYPEDTYYGGGQWIILSCWLGWYYVKAGEAHRAYYLIEWVERQADANGYLPEQVLERASHPEYIAYWKKKWGDSAVPLLWSHAMYLILFDAIKKNEVSSHSFSNLHGS